MYSAEEPLHTPSAITPSAALSALHRLPPLRRPPAPAADEAGTGLYQALLDEIDVGLVMTDPDGRLLQANRAAWRWCEAPSPLVLSGLGLRTTDPAHQPALLQALVAASQGRRSMLNLRQGKQRHNVGVVPLNDRRTGTQAVLFMLDARQQRSALNLQFFCQAHRLTLAESAVLTGLSQGLTPTEVAQANDVSVATVRSQITAIREKTQAGSLAHLQRMVAALPPLAPAGTFDN